MKHVFVAGEALADEPVAELESRTPLEFTKMPAVQALAAAGKCGAAFFTPRGLPISPDSACLSMLGYDPLEHYTGRAPLEALALGIPFDDGDLVFRCDFVTVIDGVLTDSAVNVSEKENEILIGALNKGLSEPRARFHTGSGSKNFLVVKDQALVDALDEADTLPPDAYEGKKWPLRRKKEASDAFLNDLRDRAKTLLESHEINRVRIDLGENPANRVWLWAQGRRPKLPSFQTRFGVEGAVVSDADFVIGLGIALGLSRHGTITEALKKKDFVFVFIAKTGAKPSWELKEKVRRLERFDAVVHEAAVAVGVGGKILLTTDRAEALPRKIAVRGPVPVLACPAEGGPSAFNERAAELSRWKFDEGHKLMEWFLKDGEAR